MKALISPGMEKMTFEDKLEPPKAPQKAKLQTFVREQSFWYQNIYLGHGIFSMGQTTSIQETIWSKIKPAFPADLQEKSVLDVGTNAGYFALQAKLLLAKKVTGIDVVPMFLEQAKFIAAIYDKEINYVLLDAENVASLNEVFDLVFFTGILYHLQNPLRALMEVSKILRDAIVIESEIIPNSEKNLLLVRQGGGADLSLKECRSGFMKFCESSELNDDPSNWWIPDTECVLAMLRVAGFKHFSQAIFREESRMILVASKKEESLLSLSKIE